MTPFEPHFNQRLLHNEVNVDKWKMQQILVQFMILKRKSATARDETLGEKTAARRKSGSRNITIVPRIQCVLVSHINFFTLEHFLARSVSPLNSHRQQNNRTRFTFWSKTGSIVWQSCK
jgi:hypothetical protein